MNDDFRFYLIPAVAIGFFVLKWSRFLKIRRALPHYLDRGAQLVDVRSEQEFSSGHLQGSINIPLSSLSRSADQLDSSRPVILCCASGTRSGIGVAILKKQGFQEVLNGGPWLNLLEAVQQRRNKNETD